MPTAQKESVFLCRCNIVFIKEEIDPQKSYRVEFEKDQDTGLIHRAVINEK